MTELETSKFCRDSQGRFLPGTQHKSRGHYRAFILRDKFLNAITENDVRKVVKAMMRLGAEGDVKAATLIFNYLWGKPKESVEIQKQSTTLNLSALSDDELIALQAITVKANTPQIANQGDFGQTTQSQDS